MKSDRIVSKSYEKRHVPSWEEGVGVDFLLLYLSGFRAIIILWLYGVKRFATDIHFWLGFHPTRFWTITWTLLPIILLCFMVNKCYLLLQHSTQVKYTPIIWIIFTILVVTGFQIRTIAKYLVKNYIIGLLKANKFYGPPEAEDRKLRQFYNEVTRERKCRHNCMVIDEWFDCDHENTVVAPFKTNLSTVSEERSSLNIHKDEAIPRSQSLNDN